MGEIRPGPHWCYISAKQKPGLFQLLRRSTGLTTPGISEFANLPFIAEFFAIKFIYGIFGIPGIIKLLQKKNNKKHKGFLLLVL